MLAKLKVVDYMKKKIHSISKDAEVLDAIKLLLKNQITSVCVIDEQGNLVGMFRETNAMNVVLESIYNQSMGGGTVEQFMNKDVDKIDLEMSIVDLCRKFEGTSVRTFPVFDGVDQVGMISRRDILRALISPEKE